MVRNRCCCWIFLLAVWSGCSPDSSTSTSTSDRWETIKPSDREIQAQPVDSNAITVEEMRKRLGANENAQFEKAGKDFQQVSLVKSGAKTLAPLADQPLVFLDASETEISDLTSVSKMTKLETLYLENAKVTDVSPLRELSIKKLWLNGCPVSDLSPLTGHRFEELNLCDTKITDLATVGTMNVGTLWLRNTAIQDLTPIAGLSLTSLDLEGSRVIDLSPLASMTTLRRLNLARTEITDLTPLATLSLSRLIFTPDKIEKGIDEIRQMTTLAEIDTTFDGVAKAMSASEFWERFDRGEFANETVAQ